MTDKNNFIPYGRQWIDEDDIRAVVDVLKSDWLTQGPKIEEFERQIAAYCGVQYAVVFNSGTSALHGAYFSVGLEKDDEFITTPLTFVATANAGVYLGAKPVFVDIEEDTGNIDASKIEPEISPKTKLVAPVHYAGHPVDLFAISKIAKKHGLFVVEDACHAMGAKYRSQASHEGTVPDLPTVGGLPRTESSGVVESGLSPKQKMDWIKVGSCKHSDMTVFSFHPVKHITTGEGGAVVTNNPDFHERLLMFRSHGITKRNLLYEPHGEWYYEMQLLGYNYRMTDIQAALGASQLRKLDVFVERRRKIVEAYNKAFAGNPFFDTPVERDYAFSAYHLYPLRIKDRHRNMKKEIAIALKEKGIGTQVHYVPVYQHPFYRELGYEDGLCPVAEDFYQRELSIPLYPAMSDDEVQYVEKAVSEVFGGFK